MLISLLLLTASLVRAQWDFATQAMMTAANGTSDVSVMATGYGQFVGNGTGSSSQVQLIGNDGGLVATMSGSGLTSLANVAVATNHGTPNGYWMYGGGDPGDPTYIYGTGEPDYPFPRQYLAIATAGGTNGDYVQLQICDCSGKYISMKSPNVFTGLIPPISVSEKIVSGYETSIHWINEAIHGDYVCVAWQTNTNRIGCMVVQLSTSSIVFSVSDVMTVAGPGTPPFPPSVPAVGSIPTVSSSHGIDYFGPDPFHIAYAEYISPDNAPVDYVIDPSTWTGVANALVPQPAGNKLLWVTAQEGYTVDYFYGCTSAEAGNNLYVSTDGVTIDMGVNPISTTLAFQPNSTNPVPQAAVYDFYHAWAGTDETVYLAYIETNALDATKQNLCITRETGYHTILRTGFKHESMLYSTISSNQMGSFVLSTYNGNAVVFRDFKPLTASINENTLATGLVDIQDHASIWDTIRTYGASMVFGGGNQSLTFSYTSDDYPGLYAGFDIPDFATYGSHNSFQINLEGSQPPVINLASGTQVDFGLQPGVVIGAESQTAEHGIIEYNGAALWQMNQDIIEAEGDENAMLLPGGAAPPPWDDFHERAYINFHAPCTISGGSILRCDKAFVNFDPASSSSTMDLLTISGVGTNVHIDSSNVNFGSNTTSGSLEQIVMNPTNANSQNEFMEVTNSDLATGFPGQTTPAIPSSTYVVKRSDIVCKKPDHVSFINNLIDYVYLEVRDPVTGVNYNYNNVWTGSQALFSEWTSLSTSFSGSMNVNWNYFNETWPIGGYSGDMIDIDIDGFYIPSNSAIDIEHNALYQSIQTANLTYALDGIDFDHGTNGEILFNNVELVHNFGIHTTGVEGVQPFLCSNFIWGYTCDLGIAIAILQDGYGNGYTKLNWASWCQVGFEGTGDDESNLIQNALDTNGIGAAFGGAATTELYGSHTGVDDYAGFNWLQLNGTQVYLYSTTAQPYFGPKTTAPDPINWGNNRIVSTDGQTHFYATSAMALEGDNNVTENDWSPSILTGTAVTGVSLMHNVTYDNVINIPFVNPGYSCGYGYFHTEDKGNLHSLSGHATTSNVPDSLRLYYAGLKYVNLDPLKARDTMMLYCQSHPYALYDEGEWRTAMGYVASQSSNYYLSQPQLHSGDSLASVQYWQSIFDWVVSIQTLNYDTLYQNRVMYNLCEAAERIDENLACNLWYNFTLRFPNDSETVSEAWKSIANDRRRQTMIPQDTTPFTILPFPIQSFGPEVPVEHLSVHTNDDVPSTVEMELNPNPATNNAELHYGLPGQSYVDVAIFDMLGRKISEVQHGSLSGGKGVINLDLRSIPNGHYFVRLTASGNVLTRQLVIDR